MALYTGLILWRLYVRLDSPRYPLKTYADIAERIFGRTARHIVNVLQSLQLLINVGLFRLPCGCTLLTESLILTCLGRHNLSQ